MLQNEPPFPKTPRSTPPTFWSSCSLRCINWHQICTRHWFHIFTTLFLTILIEINLFFSIKNTSEMLLTCPAQSQNENKHGDRGVFWHRIMDLSVKSKPSLSIFSPVYMRILSKHQFLLSSKYIFSRVLQQTADILLRSEFGCTLSPRCHPFYRSGTKILWWCKMANAVFLLWRGL